MARKKEIETAVEAAATKAVPDYLMSDTDAAGDVVPTFVLRADRKGHLRALMAALQELPQETTEGLATLREFDLYEEAHR